MLIKGHPVVAYDPAGVIFAVALNERSAILLYDLRLFDQVSVPASRMDVCRKRTISDRPITCSLLFFSLSVSLPL